MVRRALAMFLPAAACLTIVAALVYLAFQQAYRSGANDPQLQMASEAALRLDAGARPASVAAGPLVDLARSLAAHITIYNAAGQPLASDARLGGTIPAIPVGALNSARASGRNTVTWQPQHGVRVAAVIVPWRGGTVLVGRSLGPVEDRENNLEQLVGAVWIAGVVLLGFAALLAAQLWPPPRITPAEEEQLSSERTG